jgi:hypothetical protein
MTSIADGAVIPDLCRVRSLRPARSQEFAGFGGRTGHERHAILVAYIDMHTVGKTSCRSKMLLATVQ